MKHLNITVTGRVQGVGYRNAAKREARILGINGFVKNKYDGSVYIEAEGESPELDEFIKWCWEGPAWAHVENVLVYEGAIQNLSSFETAY